LQRFRPRAGSFVHYSNTGDIGWIQRVCVSPKPQVTTEFRLPLFAN
jgi:hypothetical protein